MKKAGIITITNSGMNFGNRLQNYALQKKLESLNVEVETIYSANTVANSLILSRLRRQLKRVLKNNKRRRCFNTFDKMYINKAPKYRYGKLNDKEFANQYDAFIAGSDQVWNPNFHFNTEFEFMTFAPSSKRYSYAASFGVDEIPEKEKEHYVSYLSNMSDISVREFSGADIVKRLAKRDAQVHVDPCMLLEAEDYKNIEVKPDNLPEKYILTYMLGHALDEYKTFIQDVSKKLNIPIVELTEIVDSDYYHIGPQHFVYLFRNAEYVCTDSFHGTAFCVLFERNFTVFKRKDSDVPMDARITTILGKMDLNDRRFGVLNAEESIKKIDFSYSKEKVKEERMISDTYLKSIIEKW